MATNVNSPSRPNRAKPWQARVTQNGQRINLGMHETREAAEAVEREWKLRHPKATNPMAALPTPDEWTGQFRYEDLHPCFRCPLADCNEYSKQCVMRQVAKAYMAKVARGEPVTDREKQEYALAYRELAVTRNNRLGWTPDWRNSA